MKTDIKESDEKEMWLRCGVIIVFTDKPYKKNLK